jgi:hypothetical protein
MGAGQVTEPIAQPVAPSGAPPVATPSPAVAPASTPPPADAPFYSTFADPELKGYAEIRGWKAPEDVVKSHREGEKLLGGPREELVRLPKDAKPEDLNAIYDRLGRPAKPEDYKLPTVEGGEDFTKAFTPVLHDMGLNQAQAEKLATAWNGYMTKAVETQAKQQADTIAADMVKLHQEWGPSYDERIEFADRAIRAGGLNEEEILAIKGALDKDGQPGNAAALRALAKIGEGFREAKGVFGDTPSQPGFGGKTLEGLIAQRTQWIGTGEPGTGDQVWQERLGKNDPVALKQLEDINRAIAAAMDARGRG